MSPRKSWLSSWTYVWTSVHMAVNNNTLIQSTAAKMLTKIWSWHHLVYSMDIGLANFDYISERLTSSLIHVLILELILDLPNDWKHTTFKR